LPLLEQQSHGGTRLARLTTFVSITFLSNLQPLQVAVDETPQRPADALSRLLLLADPDDGRPASQRLFTAGNKLSLWCDLLCAR